ncbi:ABC transporter ATP-binding protein [Methylobacterium sp. J-067]|uniref:ABC transporter ATP-binding protein n=1 Tax=Methylobacterium sp. J-067 TaxID=2836648 RepID=UPI001FBB1C60|nr:ABC transporter ATP-binding protein [Methylobacterium sp. J-067]MCJ2023451.1 ABC transporter ATP-binding protein [Methylobacterium sp. J-067]
MSPGQHIEVEDLVIRYGAVAAVGPVSFTVAAGQQLTLLGPSGCGKTTTLRAVAGLEKPSAGAIRIGGRTVYDGARGIDVPAEARGLSMVFQSYAIWPHMTVFENVAYGLRVRQKGAAEIRERVGAALDLVQMGPYADRHASQLSGGQQQRVALARACAFSPSVLLFDEPLSNLDAKLRGDMRIELRELQHRLGVTSLYVTHDLEEALAMSDKIVVMRAGQIEQSGPPSEIYNYPRTEFVADFVGSANLIQGRIRPDLTRGDAIALETPGGHLIHGSAHGRAVGDRPSFSVRTVHLKLTPQAPAHETNVWPVTVKRAIFLGDLTQVHVEWGGRELVVRQTGMQPWSEGQAASLSADPDHCILLEH